MTRALAVLRLWLLGLVALWALLVLGTSSTDPAAPLATLLVVCGGTLLLLGWSVPAEAPGRLVRGSLPDRAGESEEWRLFAVGMLVFGGVLALAAGVWWALWQLAGEPRVFWGRVVCVVVVTGATAHLVALLARAAWLSRRRGVA